ncbi:FAD-dependent thymidylate synthase, partial [Candidatus Berkelbacteria bacterium]|nr:FAD-dependent thymidylate synthase [Candidatus Berkelbacteria bacterium]
MMTEINEPPIDRSVLTNFVTDPTANVFAVKSWAMPGMVGAAYARYSRAQGGFRETLLKEFIKEGQVDAQHADELIERVLVAFGDDSVGELEGAHVSFENISVLATKEIEDRRIGGSPIEQSTRYVFYDQKTAAGQYRYYRPPRVLASAHGALYTETMDRIFALYRALIEPLQAFYRTRKPLEAA